jgi:hypothetical protein
VQLFASLNCEDTGGTSWVLPVHQIVSRVRPGTDVSLEVSPGDLAQGPAPAEEDHLETSPSSKSSPKSHPGGVPDVTVTTIVFSLSTWLCVAQRTVDVTVKSSS